MIAYVLYLLSIVCKFHNILHYNYLFICPHHQLLEYKCLGREMTEKISSLSPHPLVSLVT